MNVIETSMLKKIEQQIEINTSEVKKDIFFTKCRLYRHVYDNSVHTTAEEKAFWNNKLNVVDDPEYIIDNENLIFNRS